MRPEEYSLLQQAARAETAGDLKAAVKLYRQSLAIDPRSEKIYSRLMVLYRKLKDPARELAIIQRAIKTFTELYLERPGKKLNKKVSDTSRALMRSLGLADRKGRQLYLPQPLDRWTRRLVTVKKKMGR